jgi:hypothetical protein
VVVSAVVVESAGRIGRIGRSGVGSVAASPIAACTGAGPSSFASWLTIVASLTRGVSGRRGSASAATESPPSTWWLGILATDCAAAG